MSKISKEAFEYLNKMRQNPQIAISNCLKEMQCINQEKFLYKLNEGPKVVNECIQFLQNQKPVGPLTWSKGLECAARDHVKDTGPKGVTGHTGTDGSSMSDRIERYGEWDVTIGENISYGQTTGEDVIIQLIIDDGVSSRGHRKNCFKAEFGAVGIFDGDHKQFKTQCVFDFAGSFQDKAGLDAGGGNSQQGVAPQKEGGQSAPMQSREQAAPAKAQSKDPNDKIVKDAFDYLNQVRQNPTLPIPKLQELMKLFKGNVLYKPGEIPLQTNEGTKVIQELIAFLQKQQPLQPLTYEKGLEQACIDHVNDTGPKGVCGHTGTDGSSLSDRIERYGEWNGKIGENISYGQKNGQDVIIQLLIDDGVGSRGHRKNCFSPDFYLVGIAAGDHKQYQTQCVFDFAGEFTPKGAQGQKPKAQQQSQPQSMKDQMKNMMLGAKGGNDAQAPQNQEEEKLPPGCVSVSTSTAVTIKNGQKITKITKTYKFKDGSTKTSVQTLTEG
ncbi:unnamed protein product (macronuclear) [Paramecium tetraurelia]|uniref:SCP domain-containing protein n=1 Tax=Paramecium tetraurelia TaxID=5888 RepID=A0BYD4_PARTE|nr:uncharacterized protein GSPATT00033404001 [Paramecium tetraurelia]CAK63551.1 unnamed protein product [Paramecium tetraurelia]|eukprot:XP_001430949.1 hypothetical protein (macronuclear) [Paramecium tetraurelia strain d4-2]